MILYNNDKYACIKCIRGHRATHCQHHDRVLMKVNKRGRKSTADAMNNKDNFVIFKQDNSDEATPIELKSDDPAVLSEHGSCKGQKESLFFLKKPSDDVVPSPVKGCCSSKKSKPTQSNLELFENSNVFLETGCSCKDDHCECENCMLHRLDTDLDTFIAKNTNINNDFNKMDYTDFAQQGWKKIKSVQNEGFSINSNESVVSSTLDLMRNDYNESTNTYSENVVNELIFDHIFRKGYDNLSSIINKNTVLVMDGKRLSYELWHPQFELYLTDKITLAQLVGILTLL